jgi:hypothetical protein
MMRERVVLYINRTSSRCGACKRSAMPEETTHTVPSGYTLRDGCGATYTHISSDYTLSAQQIESIMRMRPDLPFIDPNTG